MKIKIFQVNMERDLKRVMFMDLCTLEKLFGTRSVDPSVYDLVFNGDVDVGGVDASADLEEIFRIFNLQHPDDYVGRSMSVSDIVEYAGKHYFCDSIGFVEIPREVSRPSTLISLEDHPHVGSENSSEGEG